MEHWIWALIALHFIVLALIYQELRRHTRQQKVIGDAAIRLLEMTDDQRAEYVGLPGRRAIWPSWEDDER
jgi:hypothetical protein